MDLLTRNNIKFYPTLKNTIRKIKDGLERFETLGKYKEAEIKVLPPAIQWAQSMDSVYIQIKLSHRHDAPGCLELLDEQSSVAATNLRFTATCKQSEHPMRFHLDLFLFDIVDEDKSSTGRSSVGRVNIVLKKRIPKYWKSLSREGLHMPNVRPWYDMRKRFEDEMQFYYDQEEEEVFKLIKKRKNEERKKKRKS
jgi:hypothetical protein